MSSSNVNAAAVVKERPKSMVMHLKNHKLTGVTELPWTPNQWTQDMTNQTEGVKFLTTYQLGRVAFDMDKNKSESNCEKQEVVVAGKLYLAGGEVKVDGLGRSATGLVTRKSYQEKDDQGKPIEGTGFEILPVDSVDEHGIRLIDKYPDFLYSKCCEELGRFHDETSKDYCRVSFKELKKFHRQYKCGIPLSCVLEPWWKHNKKDIEKVRKQAAAPQSEKKQAGLFSGLYTSLFSPSKSTPATGKSRSAADPLVVPNSTPRKRKANHDEDSDDGTPDGMDSAAFRAGLASGKKLSKREVENLSETTRNISQALLVKEEFTKSLMQGLKNLTESHQKTTKTLQDELANSAAERVNFREERKVFVKTVQDLVAENKASREMFTKRTATKNSAAKADSESEMSDSDDEASSRTSRASRVTTKRKKPAKSAKKNAPATRATKKVLTPTNSANQTDFPVGTVVWYNDKKCEVIDHLTVKIKIQDPDKKEKPKLVFPNSLKRVEDMGSTDGFPIGTKVLYTDSKGETNQWTVIDHTQGQLKISYLGKNELVHPDKVELA